jgi:hypothetical protein
MRMELLTLVRSILDDTDGQGFTVSEGDVAVRATAFTHNALLMMFWWSNWIASRDILLFLGVFVFILFFFVEKANSIWFVWLTCNSLENPLSICQANHTIQLIMLVYISTKIPSKNYPLTD